MRRTAGLGENGICDKATGNDAVHVESFDMARACSTSRQYCLIAGWLSALRAGGSGAGVGKALFDSVVRPLP